MIGILRILLSGLFLSSICASVAGKSQVLTKKITDNSFRLTFGNFDQAAGGTLISDDNIVVKVRVKQSVTKACGLTGDGIADSFGLAGQFTSSGKRKKRQQEDQILDQDEMLDIEGRIFKVPRRKVQNVQKIVGGADTTPTRICWQVLIVSTTPSGSTQKCGGVIVGSQTVLTLGQCLLDASTRVQMKASAFQVVVGALDSNAPASNSMDTTGCAQTFTVSAAVLHPSYNDNVNDNDLALLTLSTAINIDQKACACILCLKSRQPNVGESCVVSGYGSEVASGTSNRSVIPLKWATQKVVSQSDTSTCPVFQDSAGVQTNTANFICTTGAVGQDPCLGDEGGALACYDPTTSSHYLAGLYSFGSVVCGQGKGDQNTKIINYLSWILQTALPNDVVIADGSVTVAPSTTTPLPSTFVPPSGSKSCGLPGNNAIDPFGIVGHFAGKANKQRIRGGASLLQRIKLQATGRIIGGFDAPATEICWQAYVLADLPLNGGTVTCGGIIIGSQTILTAASCLLDLDGKPIVATSVFVNVGAINSGAPTTNANDPLACAQEYNVQTAFIHEKYIYATNDNDLALLTLTEAIDLQNKKCACTLCLTDRIPAINETCIMSGYGYETADQTLPRDPIPLKWVKQTLQTQNVGSSGNCAVYRDPTTNTLTNLTNFLCTAGAVGQDQCIGDNGGPLACYNPLTSSYYAAGVISISAATCGTGAAGQSVKLANYLQWIVNHTLLGDVFINSTTVVTQPTVATIGTTTPLTTAAITTTLATTTTTTPTTTTTTTTPTTTTTTTTPTTTLATTTATTPTTSPTTSSTTSTSTSTTTTTTAVNSLTCGKSGNGVLDPFNLTQQFSSSGTLKQLDRFNFVNGEKIVGGVQAQAKQICWQTLVIGNLGNNFVQYCGGVIIGSQTILTAGHCTYNSNTGSIFAPSDMTVVVGSLAYPVSSDTSGCAQTMAVSQVIPNPSFNQNNLDNDIALLILANPLNLASSTCYCPICVTDRLPVVGETCIISGFGSQTTSDTATSAVTFLAWVGQKVRTQSNDGSCEVLVDPNTGASTDLNDFICAGGQVGEDTCHGDSGGPFFCFNPTTSSHYVAGVTSFGTDPCGTTTGSQYTKVAHYLDFIRSNAPIGDVDITLTGTVTTLIPSSSTTSTTTTSTTTTTTSSPAVFTTTITPASTSASGSGQTTSSSTGYYQHFYPGYNMRRG